MFQLRTVPGPAQRSQPRVAACIVTRAGRERYLQRTLNALRRCDITTLLWVNGASSHKQADGHSYYHSHPFNVGQHVAHNEMLDECVRLDVDWHIRVDDDCWLGTRKWLPRLLDAQEAIKRQRNKYAVLGLDIAGLQNPPLTTQAYEFGRERLERVDVLGGIFRMSHMSIMRYFRWDERLPMGFGEASQFASFAKSIDADMFRVSTVKASHGESTKKQQQVNEAW